MCILKISMGFFIRVSPYDFPRRKLSGSLYFDLSWFITNYIDLSWFIMIYHDLSWFIMNHKFIKVYVVQHLHEFSLQVSTQKSSLASTCWILSIPDTPVVQVEILCQVPVARSENWLNHLEVLFSMFSFPNCSSNCGKPLLWIGTG